VGSLRFMQQKHINIPDSMIVIQQQAEAIEVIQY
jgi:hypothetical protein